MKLSSKDLLDRLKKKGICKSEFTRKLIIDKLNDDEEVATTSVKVSVSCPLGKMRMQVRWESYLVCCVEENQYDILYIYVVL